MSRNKSMTYPSPLPKVVKTKADYMTDLTERLDDLIGEAKRQVARSVDIKLTSLTKASTQLESENAGSAIYDLKNLYSGMRSMYEELGKLEVLVMMRSFFESEKAEGGSPDKVFTRLHEYLDFLSFNDNSIADLSSSDQFSNATNASMGEGRMRARRDLNHYLKSVANNLLLATA